LKLNGRKKVFNFNFIYIYIYITQETLARRSSLDRSGASVIILFSHAGLYFSIYIIYMYI